MEKTIKIPLKNSKNIYGILRGDLSSPLIIFVHGFTGHKNEHQFFNAARFFEDKGFSTFRFDLYGWEEDARKLEDCTLSLHGQDLDRVVDFFRKEGVEKLFVVGHSFGGVTVLLSKKKDFDAMVLWEASDNPSKVTKSKYVTELDKYYVTAEASYGFTIGKEMFEETQTLNPRDLIKKINKPSLVVVAGNGELVDGGKKFFKNANEPKKFVVIPNATHCFDEDGAEENLFQETLAWFNKFV
ncbi:MAG: hypothetical protein COX79_01165 [Candidatus Levybacteria bacterium CG_4_10_14_0_2_um_filter_36_16]|nr:MAG: hypothetical protein AUK12_03950 [Candidatus Levybacteria bacterium CG2_30_37_29]PIR79457.1 MAG: hypothetical protein COU26_01045 [Candidatus Levybacteria bacterium CG10_big_fil_rev_8_21_14_0_10_36_30]PIZ97744.1 MAG: hypothetical protein COX79_01165 [Candidatus Levybacteria bacterium CG_4_10_14_0_2_um_filter_36_16]